MIETQINLLSIDAWRDGPGWTWNAWYKVGVLPLSTCDLSTRRLLNFLRSEGYLTNRSKGRVGVEDDGYNVVIFDRRTGEPLFALEYGPAVL